MKRMMITAAAVGLLAATSCQASVLTVRLEHSSTGTVFSLNGRQMPLADVLGLLKKVAQLDTNQQVLVIADDKALAETLVEVVSGIQEIGLHSLVLISSGEKNGKTGMFNVTVDATRRRFGACVGEFDSGFMESPDYTLEKIGTNMPANKASEATSEPAPGAASSSPQR
jgi:hypothetical protein